MCELTRYYHIPPREWGDLTWPQVQALLKQIGERPYEYMVEVQPKKDGRR